jgi:hypothetical protein
MIWGSIAGALIVGSTLVSLYLARTDLSDRVYDDSIAACAEDLDPEACRARVDELHDDCFQWALTRHDEYPEVDRGRYADCLEHPPGKFRDSSN